LRLLVLGVSVVTQTFVLALEQSTKLMQTNRANHQVSAKEFSPARHLQTPV
jgi:hypothetical protein